MTHALMHARTHAHMHARTNAHAQKRILVSWCSEQDRNWRHRKCVHSNYYLSLGAQSSCISISTEAVASFLPFLPFLSIGSTADLIVLLESMLCLFAADSSEVLNSCISILPGPRSRTNLGDDCTGRSSSSIPCRNGWLAGSFDNASVEGRDETCESDGGLA